MPADGIERDLHKAMYGSMQRAVSAAEVAITEARQIAYAVLRGDDVPEDSKQQMAVWWLDRFGRDSLRELDIPEQFRGEATSMARTQRPQED